MSDYRCKAVQSLPVTIKGVPREGLTIKYQHPSTRPADPADMASEAARVIGAVGIGTAGGAAIGAIIGKVVLGGTLARIGVASAGAAIGIPILAPVALAGGAISTAAYAAYKIGKDKREQENAEELLKRFRLLLWYGNNQSQKEENTMSRYYETDLPRSNYHEALSEVALGENNHIARVFIDDTNEYGARIIVNCRSEHDPNPHWYSIRDHKGDVFVAKFDHPSDAELNMWKLVWKDGTDCKP